MKRAIQHLLFSGTLLLALNVQAQTDGWKTEKTNEGKILVKSRVSERIELGNTFPLIEYETITRDYLSFQKCISIMKDVSKHGEFLDLKTQETIKILAPDEWVNYYVFSAPWPFSPTECVVKVNYKENVHDNTAVFNMTAAPEMMKKTAFKRFDYYNYTYVFKDLGNNQVEITIISKMSLPFSVPLWLLRSALPESASDPLQKLVNIIKNN